MAEKIELGDVIGAARSGLREVSNFTYSQFAGVVLLELETRHLIQVPKSALTPVDGVNQTFLKNNVLVQALMSECFYYLHHHGYVIGRSSWPNPPDLSQVYVTDRGREWLGGDDPIPEDIKHYIGVLKSLVVKIDPVVEQYIREALITFNRQAYFASAVMLGAAAEKAIYLLAEALHDTVSEMKEKRKLYECIHEKRSIPALFNAIEVSLSKIDMPYKEDEGSRRHLLSFFEAIRVQRNEAVHPAAGTVTPARVRLCLTGFPQALRVITQMTTWISNSVARP